MEVIRNNKKDRQSIVVKVFDKRNHGSIDYQEKHSHYRISFNASLVKKLNLNIGDKLLFILKDKNVYFSINPKTEGGFLLKKYGNGLGVYSKHLVGKIRDKFDLGDTTKFKVKKMKGGFLFGRHIYKIKFTTKGVKKSFSEILKETEALLKVKLKKEGYNI